VTQKKTFFLTIPELSAISLTSNIYNHW